MGLFAKRSHDRIPDSLDADSCLRLANAADDPVYRHQLLKKADELAPNNLAVQRALLMLGRLHERDPKNIDFSVIKCFALHVFESPDKHTEQDIREKTRELFDHPQLKKCLALSSDPDAFLRGYLEELCLEYIRVFLASSSAHSPSLLGFTLKHSAAKCLAAPIAKMLQNMLSSAYLRANEQTLLAGVFYRACHRYLNGETRYLDAALSPEVIKALQ